MNESPTPEHERVRLQKFLASAGVGSRRACEAMILEGRIEVNGQVVRRLGSRIEPGRDRVKAYGQPVQPRRRLHLALHKPVGYVCSRRQQGRDPGVLDLLPIEWRDVYPVGRLDRDSEGLLLLTNDGDFCLRLTHPRFGVSKTYVATVRGRVEAASLAALTRGIQDRGERLRASEVRLLSSNQTRSRIEVVLTEGRNREIRRLFAALGQTVEQLVRHRVGPLALGELPPGKWRVLQRAEVNALLAAARPSSGSEGNPGRKGRARRVAVDRRIALPTNGTHI